jgi:hypothetical protein
MRCDAAPTSVPGSGHCRSLNELRGSGAHHTYPHAPAGLRRSAFHAGAADVVTFVWDGQDLLNEMIECACRARGRIGACSPPTPPPASRIQPPLPGARGCPYLP